MTSHNDVIPYLVAVKSLYRFVGVGNFFIIDDGSMTEEDRSIIRHHLVDVEICHISTIDTGLMPRGGTWERLLTIVDLSATTYVIQVDSDTLALGPIPEVVDCFRRNVGFTLAGGATSKIERLSEASARVKGQSHGHVQLAIEQRFDQFPASDRLLYVRGCSGFAGFARGGTSRENAQNFSTQAEGLLGARWSEWGTEQVTSNYLIANMPNAVLLPYDRYANLREQRSIDGLSFAHFIGSHRYAHGMRYTRLSRSIIQDLH